MYCYCPTVVDEVSLQKRKWSTAKKQKTNCFINQESLISDDSKRGLWT